MRSAIGALVVPKLYLIFLIILPIVFTGCGEDEKPSLDVPQGWHYQGRDCLGCHNVDLENNKHLLVGGTLYKNSTVTDGNDLSQVCGGEFVIEFFDTVPSLQISSVDYEDLNSSGYQGKGNMFILSRKLDTLSLNYFIRISDRNNNVLVSSTLHQFNSSDYNINSSTNLNNTLSCNSCHRLGGIRQPIRVDVSKQIFCE